MNPVIPTPVPIPLPAPVGLLHFLLVFTFILHVLAMDLLVGGAAMLTVSSFLGQRHMPHREFTRRAARALPPVAAFTITLGVAPLLFLQLVYGQLFYTSSVLMAWAWLAVVFFVLLGYYGVYWFNLQHDELGPRAPWVILLTTLLFVFVAFIFVQNMTFMLRPADFFPQFLRHEVGSVLGPVTALGLARLLHFLVGAAAVAGLGVALLSRVWSAESPELASWARRYGLKWFMAGTGVEFLIGAWFLAGLPENIRGLFLGGDRLGTALLVVAIALAVSSQAVARKSLLASSVAILGAISLMAVIRHWVRVAYLRPYFDPHALPVQGQWVVFVLFALLLVAGLATVAWMLCMLFRPSARAM
jgi:hypothetical protein